MIQDGLKINGISLTPMLRGVQPVPTEKEIQALLESIPDPVKLLANLPATRSEWSPQLEKALNLLKEYFPKQTGVAHFQLFMQVVRDAPELLKPLTDLLNGLRAQKATPAVAENFLELAGNLLRGFSEAAAAAQTAEQGARLTVKKRELIQVMDHLRWIVAGQKGPEAARSQALGQMAGFLAHAAREHPESFGLELFAAPLAADAGIDLITYQALAHEAEPLRLAQLLIAARQKGPAVLAALVVELQKAVNGGEPALPVVERWEKSLTPAPIPPSNRPNVVVPSEGFITFAEGEHRALYLAALDPQEGLLPPQAWQVAAPDGSLTAIQSSLLMLGAYPTGFNRLKATVKGKKKAESGLEFLFWILRPDEAQEAAAAEPEPPDSPAPQPYAASQVLPELTSPLSGSIELAVNGPYILMGGYDPDRTVPAPLQVSFKFLADVVDPRTLHSRTEFLTLPQSPEVKGFRDAVRRLSSEGLKAYNDYLDGLTALFKRLEGALPVGVRTLEAAKHYLRDQVMLYLLGRKRADGAQGPVEMVKAIEASPKGDVMASICSTVAGACAAGGQVGEALIHFSDAAQVAVTKPYFFGRLQKFFQDIKTALGTPGPGAYWRGDLPVLPPGPFDSSGADAQSTALARTFVANLKIS